MDIIEDFDLLSDLPDPKYLLEGFKHLTENRFLLLKKGKLLKRPTYRYFVFTNDSLTYYKSASSQTPKGTISLVKSFAVPFSSFLPTFAFSIKVITSTSHEFYIFSKTNDEFDMIMTYIKLSSNSQLQSVLDKICFTAVNNEFHIINALKTPKNAERFLTPKNVISRFLFSPSSEGNFDAPEENILVRLPKSIYCHENLAEVPEEETIVEVQELNTQKFVFNETPKLEGFKVLENARVEEIRDLGVKYLWNYQLEYAKKTFESIKFKDPRSALHLCEVCLFRVLITGRKSDIKSIMEELESFQKFYSGHFDSISEILNAELLLYKSILMLITGQKFKAFISLRNCWKTFRKYENFSNFDVEMKSRVELGIGLFLLLISLAPSSISAILRLAGFCSNKDEGLLHLHRCFELNSSHSPYAGIVLSLYYTDLDQNLKKATEMVTFLIENYSGCVLLHWVNSIISWKNNQIEAAIENLSKALFYCGEELSNQAAFIKYELGWFYFLRFEWESARKQFENILMDTLSLSSELDEAVKHLLLHGKIEENFVKTFESIVKAKKGQKKKKKNWLESNKTPDRVYLPHKSCLITQYICCISTNNAYDENWLKIIQASANYPNSHSSLDEDFGGLSQSYMNRKSLVLMPYEVIYFMKQHTKLLSYMLIRVYNIASEVIAKVNKDQDLAEYCSARMLQIMALALNGDTTLAMEICNLCVPYIDQLPHWAIYIAPHLLYWCARVYIAEDHKKIASNLLKKAKKYKKYIFDISPKIDRVMTDLL